MSVMHITFAIDFTNDIAAPLVEDFVYNFGEEDVQWLKQRVVDPDRTLLENLKNIFYPPVFGDEAYKGWLLWQMIRTVWVGILVLAFIRAWARLILNAADEEERQKSIMNIVYIIYGVVLFFGATWIMETLLDIWNFKGFLSDDSDSFLNKVENNIVLQVIWFLKALAFFLAIVMVARYWYQMATAMDSEERLWQAKTGLLNVILALVFIKIIDFIYFIAQTGEFQQQGVEFITNFTTFLSFAFGALIFFMLIYIWFLYLTSAGEEDRINDAKRLLRNIVVVFLVVALFLLIIYQVLADLG